MPKFGIEKEVRVCEDCYEKANTTTVPKSAAAAGSAADKSKASAASASSAAAAAAAAVAKTPTSPPGKTDEELREEEELQMAIALSKSEAEVKEKQQRKYSNSYQSFNNFESELNKPLPQQSAIDKEQLDPNLNLYMNRAYWEQKSKENSSKRLSDAKPSAPQQTLPRNSGQSSAISKQSENEQPYGNHTTTTTTLLKGESDEENNIEQFQNNLRSTIEIFVNRMNSNKNRGRPISNDSAVQSMFLNITNMHSQLLKHIQQQDDQRSKFELLQDKLSQAKDARAALDSLREEYNEKLRREAEEAEMIRQQQMAFKLDIMRKKKQEYLQYQRQIALQRIQDEERQMKMRLEQQKYGVWPNPQMPPPTSMPGQPPYPTYPIQNYSQPINYGDPSSIYNQPHHPMPQQQLPPNQVNHYPPQPNGQIPYSPMQQHQQPPQQQSTNPHISTQQQQQVIPPHLEMPIHHPQQQQHIDPSATNANYPPTSYGHQPAGVYNMQAMNNSLPPAQQQPAAYAAEQPTSQPETSQSNISIDHSAVSSANTSAVNTSVVNTSIKQVDEAPLISFD